MMQAEKALREAGWEEVLYGDLGKDDEFFHLPTGVLLIGTHGILNSGDKVLRAPRPEPEYEPGDGGKGDTE